MAENLNQATQNQAGQGVQEHTSESAAREALLRLRRLVADLPPVDAVAVVRAGRESETKAN